MNLSGKSPIKFAACALAVLLTLAGCESMSKPSAGSSTSQPSAASRGLLGAKLAVGAPPTESVKLMFDTNSADNRRRGIDEVSTSPWGQQENYCKYYVLLLHKDDNPLVRASAVRALTRTGSSMYLGDLVYALSDASNVVRWDAAVGLDTIWGEAAMDPLRQLAVDDESADVRAASARALRHYRQDRVSQTLMRCLEDTSFAVRYQAHNSLVEITGKDFGWYAQDWSNQQAPQNPLAGAPEKPWWDWMGVTDNTTNPNFAAGTKPSSSRTATSQPRQRPWWDWMGVTQQQSNFSDSQTGLVGGSPAEGGSSPSHSSRVSTEDASPSSEAVQGAAGR